MNPVVRSFKTLDVRCRFGRPEFSLPCVARFRARPTQAGHVLQLKLGRG